MKKQKGLTIIQLMIVIGAVGIVLWYAVNRIIYARCEETPEKQMCVDRKAKR